MGVPIQSLRNVCTKKFRFSCIFQVTLFNKTLAADMQSDQNTSGQSILNCRQLVTCFSLHWMWNAVSRTEQKSTTLTDIAASAAQLAWRSTAELISVSLSLTLKVQLHSHLKNCVWWQTVTRDNTRTAETSFNKVIISAEIHPYVICVKLYKH